MASTLPDYTRSVITLGSPFRGHPASTRAWRVYRMMNRNNLEKMFTDEALATRAAPLGADTCIYSRNDGIVAWECCCPSRRRSPRTSRSLRAISATVMRCTRCGSSAIDWPSPKGHGCRMPDTRRPRAGRAV